MECVDATSPRTYFPVLQTSYANWTMSVQYIPEKASSASDGSHTPETPTTGMSWTCELNRTLTQNRKREV